MTVLGDVAGKTDALTGRAAGYPLEFRAEARRAYPWAGAGGGGATGVGVPRTAAILTFTAGPIETQIARPVTKGPSGARSRAS